MKYYKFIYSFGPYEGDYIFLFSTESELNETIREKAYNKCLSLIDKNIDEEHEFIRLYKENNNEEWDGLGYSLKDYMNKRDFLVKHKHDVINGNYIKEDFNSIDIYEMSMEFF